MINGNPFLATFMVWITPSVQSTVDGNQKPEM